MNKWMLFHRYSVTSVEDNFQVVFRENNFSQNYLFELLNLLIFVVVEVANWCKEDVLRYLKQNRIKFNRFFFKWY